jgi:ribosomal protein S18 acetylase RimI-like enzyme
MGTDLKYLVKLNTSQVKPAADVLARAFRDYPIAEFAFPDREDRARRAPYTHRLVLSYCIRYGEAYATSERFEAVAAWLPPEQVTVSMWKLIRSGALQVMRRFGTKSGRRMRKFSRHLDSAHERNAPFPHWYLWNIGVDPSFQGKGYAGKLLTAMFVRIDKEGVPCYLVTQKETNLPLYQHYGFKVVEQFIIPGTEFTNWAMLREPADTITMSSDVAER